MEPGTRVVLVHLNVSAPSSDIRTADEIADAIQRALYVVRCVQEGKPLASEQPPARMSDLRNLTIEIPLAEEV